MPHQISRTISNIPINVPRHFLGRDHDLAAIEAALNSGDGRAAITALHGLRGVGKTVLAAAYAERHSRNYRATWWIRAETEATMRADLVGLGVQLGWVAADAPEKDAAIATLDRLRHEGEGILLIYDNAVGPKELATLLPRTTGPQIIVTSNAPNWGGVAERVEIEVWPEEVGVDFLIARTGLMAERDAAFALSKALGGLPLAHEQAAAYCERIGLSLAGYQTRFEAAPVAMLDEATDVAREYGRTVAKTFALAIEEAGRRNAAAESLITYVASLAPEPIPLYLFSEGRTRFSDPFASLISGDGLDEAVAALRAFALVEREAVPDERISSMKTDCIRLHRLVREVAAAKETPDTLAEIRGQLIQATVAVYPGNVRRNPEVWPRARRLDAIAMALVDVHVLPSGSQSHAANLLGRLQGYRDGVLAAYAEAQRLAERGLAIREKELGPNDPGTAISLASVGYLMRAQGNNIEARAYYDRALAIDEEFYGRDHPEVATDLCNLGGLLKDQGDYEGARRMFERALAIDEKFYGPDHREVAFDLNNLGVFLKDQGDFAGARLHVERALAIFERVLDPHHPEIATSLDSLGGILQSAGEYAGARSYIDRALTIRENALGSDHPMTATSLNNLGYLLRTQGDLAEARPYYERALVIHERKLGLSHPRTRIVADNTAALFDQLKLPNEAAAIRQKFGLSKKS